MDLFSTRLRAAREARNLSQEELAKLVLLSPDALARLERGSEPKGSAVVDLARVLGVSCDYLLCLDAAPAAAPPAFEGPAADQMRQLLKTTKGSSIVDLAQTLGVSSDHLLGVDPPPATAAVEDRADLTPDMRRLLKTARRLGVRELNLVAQLADALLAKQAEP